MTQERTEKPQLSIKARNIGPIINLDGVLSEHKQNLIFARSGTGKSFIARAFRLLDQVALSEMDRASLSDLLVSEESDGMGSFALFEGERSIGNITLDTSKKLVIISDPTYIFHVFSEDYIDENLRNKLEELDGNIKHEIIVGKENAELAEMEKLLEEKNEDAQKRRKSLNTVHQKSLDEQQKEFQIRGSLGSFRLLSSEAYFNDEPFSADENMETTSSLQKDYDNLKSIPSETDKPRAIVAPDIELNLPEMAAILGRQTSRSSVGQEFREKITSDPEFFEKGLMLYQLASDSCPFCTQEMGAVAIAAVNAYSTFFDDKEATETKLLKGQSSFLTRTVAAVDNWLVNYLANMRLYDELKSYFPSLAQTVLPDCSGQVENLKAALQRYIDATLSKLENLSLPVQAPEERVNEVIAEIGKQVASANKSIIILNASVENSDSERRSIQNKSCQAFEREFLVQNKAEIDAIRALSEGVAGLVLQISKIRKLQGDKALARDRVAQTFSTLLKRFFGDRYSFDDATFKVRRNNMEMRRGSDRTLSDGEKAALAFCYFIAQTHLRVETNDDYDRIFFVFDDPVTSMSFDYVYSIAQALKLLRIGVDGEIQFNMRSDVHRPRMLILTHNNYFFNIVSSSNVAKKDGLFQLVSGVPAHSLKNQRQFATPHFLQLRHVHEVANGITEPDYHTPNSVRSVIEGMWKFRRPDITDFEGFLRTLIDDYGIEIRSVLINHFSHHTGLDMLADGEDIKLAAAEVIAVVKKVAPGQVKNL